ncbi:cob(I)alamin adenosyltransferase, partial [Dehalococcoides mccartyi]
MPLLNFIFGAKPHIWEDFLATNHTPYLEKGLISIFTGEGKGKTSAAVGNSVRAAGHGLRVCLIFFAKGKRFDHGEFKILSSLPN